MFNFKFIKTFFYAHPVLYVAIFFTIGIATFFYPNFFFLIFCCLIWNKKSFFLALASFSFAFLYSYFLFSDAKLVHQPIEGSGLFEISSIKEKYNFKKKYYIYKGKFTEFKTEDKIYNNINCSVFSKIKYSLNHNYLIEGNLNRFNDFNFYLKAKKPWIKEKKRFNFLTKRYLFKKNFYFFLKKILKDKNLANFMHTLISGENSHNYLSFSFSKLGLQHVLAISGFHFGIFTILVGFFLKLFFKRQFTVYILLVLVNLYFLFIGPLISVQRAYLMIQIALFSQIINRKYFALNGLGLSLIILLLLNPLNIINVGFQLSFLCSFAILIGYPVYDEFFERLIIKKRTVFEKKELNFTSRIGDKIFNFLRQSLCISFSVNTFILPVLLYHFNKFAYLSLIYNLFIPFLVGICMMTVLLGSLTYFIINPLSYVINSFNIIFIKFILKLILHPPASLQYYLRYKNLSFEFILVYLFLMGGMFLIFREVFEKKSLPEYTSFL